MKTKPVPSYVIPLFEEEKASFLGQKLGVSSLTGQLLINRGIDNEESAKQFLHPRLSYLRPPQGTFEMAGFSPAVERLKLAILRKEKIGIFGDYDVDGVTTCALLTDFLQEFEVTILPKIAKRNDGYGFSVKEASTFKEEGCSLVVTGDCGTSDYEAISFCNTANLDVIVVDHHQVPDKIPEAVALLNPHRADCLFPFKGLASVGVAFYLVAALRTQLKEMGYVQLPELRQYLDLVALGTIADLAPLTEENRILVSVGLQELKNTKRPGLIKLASLSGLSDGVSSVSEVAFRIAPRLNAPGRLGNSEHAIGVLLEKDTLKAEAFALSCEKWNQERQEIQKIVFEEARVQAAKWLESQSSEVLVLASQDWHSGVVGIVASKLVEEYNRPVIIIAIEHGVGRGSARTSHGFHLYQGLKKAAPLLTRFGGHASAAGLSIALDQIDAFRQAICAAYKEQLGPLDALKTIPVEAKISLEQIDAQFVEEFSKLAPFGMGNPEPVFLVQNVELSDASIVGKEHLQVKLRSGTKEEHGIAFGFAFQKSKIPLGSKVEAAIVPEIDTYYKSRKRIRLRCKEIHPC